MSTLKVNTLEPRSSTTITVPTGNVFTIADNSGISIGGTVVSSTAAELNVLDGIPAGLTATELGYSDGVTSGIQAQINTKGVGDALLATAQNMDSRPTRRDYCSYVCNVTVTPRYG